MDQIAAGLWAVRVPIPDSPLRDVFVYIFETANGPVLVDAGWNDGTSYDTLAAALTSLGHDVGSLYGVLVTHHHRDHSGLVPRLTAGSNAYVAMHAADARILREPAWFHRRIDTEELAADGVPVGSVEDMRRASSERFPPLELAAPVRELEDGERADVPGWDVTAIWTPGHTPGHLCFVVHLAGRRLLLSGDHVLPRITPNVGLTSRDNANPLRDYRASLRKVLDAAPDAEILPAHEWRFGGLTERVLEIEAHHEARLAELRTLLRAGPMSAWEVASTLTWKRPWSSLDALGQLSALNEARAHLAFLAGDGVLTATTSDPRRWVIAS